MIKNCKSKEEFVQALTPDIKPKDKKEYTTAQMKDVLTLADNYAKKYSTCKKTAVGCYLVAETEWRTVISKGCNSNPEESCKKLGCLREEKFGNNSKEHRNTCRCHGRHAEQDALLRAFVSTRAAMLRGSTAFVTRYPCEDCAKALLDAGVKRIVYGREFPVSEETTWLCEQYGAELTHIADWNCDPKDTNS